MSAIAKKVLVMLLAIAAGYLLILLVAWARFDGAAEGQHLVAWVAENPRLALHWEGAPRLALLPRPALVLERGALGGRDGQAGFATFEEARLNLAWGVLLGGVPRVTGIALRGVAADLAAAGVFHGSAAHGSVLRLERAFLTVNGAELDGEGSGSGLGLNDLRLHLQSAPAGQGRNLAVGLNGLYGAEKFDLRLAVAALRREAQGFAAQDVNLVAQWNDADSGFDVALRIPELVGDGAAAQAEQAVLAVNHLWPSGRLTLSYHGAASVGLAGAWLAWPAARLEVTVLDGGRGELTQAWSGATRFEAAQARPGVR